MHRGTCCVRGIPGASDDRWAAKRAPETDCLIPDIAVMAVGNARRMAGLCKPSPGVTSSFWFSTKRHAAAPLRFTQFVKSPTRDMLVSLGHHLHRRLLNSCSIGQCLRWTASVRSFHQCSVARSGGFSQVCIPVWYCALNANLLGDCSQL